MSEVLKDREVQENLVKRYFLSSLEAVNQARRGDLTNAVLVELDYEREGIILANRKYNEGGDNTEGDKYFVKARFTDKNGGKREERMFVKYLNADSVYRDFFPEYGSIPMLEKYIWLKERGFPVVPTLMIGWDKEEVLMTDVTEGGKNIIIDKQNTLAKAGIKIVNLEKLKEEVIEVSERAFREGILLNIDAFSVVVSPDGLGRLMLIDIGTRTYFVTEGMKSESDDYENGEHGRKKSIDRFVKEVLAC